MLVRSFVPLLCTSLAACSMGTGGLASPRGQISQSCAAAARVDTTSWQIIPGGAFSFRVPPTYSQQETRSIDSAVDQWRSPEGKVVDSDYGLWTGRFERGPDSRMRDPVTVCATGDSTSQPQIVLYRTTQGGQAAGLYWPVPGGRSREFGIPAKVWREALWLEASSPRADDLPELLAIIQSVQLRRPR